MPQFMLGAEHPTLSCKWCSTKTAKVPLQKVNEVEASFAAPLPTATLPANTLPVGNDAVITTDSGYLACAKCGQMYLNMDLLKS